MTAGQSNINLSRRRIAIAFALAWAVFAAAFVVPAWYRGELRAWPPWLLTGVVCFNAWSIAIALLELMQWRRHAAREMTQESYEFWAQVAFGVAMILQILGLVL
jgi:hypothetical protein